jgi:hypothetical protein
MGGVTVVQGIVNVGVLGAVNNFCVLGAVPTIGYYSMHGPANIYCCAFPEPKS